MLHSLNEHELNHTKQFLDLKDLISLHESSRSLRTGTAYFRVYFRRRWENLKPELKSRFPEKFNPINNDDTEGQGSALRNIQIMEAIIRQHMLPLTSLGVNVNGCFQDDEEKRCLLTEYKSALEASLALSPTEYAASILEEQHPTINTVLCLHSLLRAVRTEGHRLSFREARLLAALAAGAGGKNGQRRGAEEVAAAAAAPRPPPIERDWVRHHVAPAAAGARSPPPPPPPRGSGLPGAAAAGRRRGGGGAGGGGGGGGGGVPVVVLERSVLGELRHFRMRDRVERTRAPLFELAVAVLNAAAVGACGGRKKDRGAAAGSRYHQNYNKDKELAAAEMKTGCSIGAAAAAEERGNSNKKTAAAAAETSQRQVWQLETAETAAETLQFFELVERQCTKTAVPVGLTPPAIFLEWQQHQKN